MRQFLSNLLYLAICYAGIGLLVGAALYRDCLRQGEILSQQRDKEIRTLFQEQLNAKKVP